MFYDFDVKKKQNIISLHFEFDFFFSMHILVFYVNDLQRKIFEQVFRLNILK